MDERRKRAHCRWKASWREEEMVGRQAVDGGLDENARSIARGTRAHRHGFPGIIRDHLVNFSPRSELPSLPARCNQWSMKCCNLRPVQVSASSEHERERLRIDHIMVAHVLA